jgi:hypothetical protein
MSSIDYFSNDIFTSGNIVANSGNFNNGLIAYSPVFVYNLPTDDPMASGQLWNSNGYLKISSGESVTPTVTPTITPSITPTVTPTETVTPTPTVTPTNSSTESGFLVSNSTKMNGTYCPDGQENGKTMYAKTTNYEHIIFWDGVRWVLLDDNDIVIMDTNDSATDTPPLTGWSNGSTLSSTSCD